MFPMLRDCGFAGLLVVLLAVLALALAGVAVLLAFLKGRAGAYVGLLALGLALVVSAGGVGGTAYGRSKVDQALQGPSLSRDSIERIRAQGYREAGECTTLGLGASALPLLLAGVATAVGFTRRRPATSG